MPSPRGPRKTQSSPRLGARRKSPLKRFTRSSTAPASRLWGDSIKAVRIASGIHKAGARTGRVRRSR